MPATFIQAANSGNAQWAGGAHTTVVATFGSTVGVGNTVAGHVTFDSSVNTVDTVTDDKGNNYNLDISAPITGDGQGHLSYYLTNITNGPKVITVNFTNAGCSFTYSQVVEFSGVLSKDVGESQVLTAPGTGTDAVASSVSGTAPTQTGDLILGFYHDDTGADASLAAGTTFTLRDTALDASSKVILGIESVNYGSVAAKKATFTVPTGTGHYSTIMTAFKTVAPTPTIAKVIDFETGDGTQMAALGALSSVQTANVNSGLFSLKQAAGASTPKTGLASTQTAIRLYLYVPALPGSAMVFLIENSTARLDVRLNTNGTMAVLDAGSTLGLTLRTGTAVIPAATEFRFELVYDLAAGGVIQTYINGVLDINTTHSNDVTALVTDRYRIAAQANPNEWYYDDIRIDTGTLTPIGALPATTTSPSSTPFTGGGSGMGRAPRRYIQSSPKPTGPSPAEKQRALTAALRKSSVKTAPIVVGLESTPEITYFTDEPPVASIFMPAPEPRPAISLVTDRPLVLPPSDPPVVKPDPDEDDEEVMALMGI